MSLRKIALSALFLLVSACTSTGTVVSTGDRYTPTMAEVSDYELDTGDKIRVTVYNEAALSGEFNVKPDGMVSLPLIGNILARGQTIDQVASTAEARFADGFLRTPQVAAEVVEFRPFFILGEVATPGSYPYSVGLTVNDAVALAKGFTPRANKDVIGIRRKGATEEISYELTPNLHVYPGDTILIGERFF
jgi:polysaccharide biosynthesis/export protein